MSRETRVGVMNIIDFSVLRTLIIDDNVHTRRMLRAILHGLGVRDIKEADDGATGLESFQTYSPDIILLDWVMPIFDGIEVTRMVRNVDSSPNPFIPIIMITAHAERHRVVTARDAGITEFLCKPLSAKALHDRIVNIVLNPRPFVRTKTYFGPDHRRNASLSSAGAKRIEPDLIDQR